MTESEGTPLAVNVIRHQDAFLALEPEWNQLLRASRADEIFLSWEWVHTWCQVVRPWVRLFVVTVRDRDGRLVGIAPHYLADFRLLGVVPYKILRTLGDYASGAEYLDWIVDAGLEAPVSNALAQTLARHGSHWDGIWMPFVPGWTGASQRVLEACQAAGLKGRKRSQDFGLVNLPAGFPQYLAALSRNARSMLSRRGRALDDEGFAFDACTDRAALPSALDDLFRLNHLRWRSAGQDGTFVRKPLEARFYSEFAPVALARGWLRLFSARIKGEIKAVQYGYVYKGAFLQVQEGFDPAAPQGLGNVLRSRVIESCIGEGLAVYDFLAGYTDHKRRWGAVRRDGHDFFISGGGVKGRLLSQGGLWPTGRYLRPVRLPG